MNIQPIKNIVKSFCHGYKLALIKHRIKMNNGHFEHTMIGTIKESGTEIILSNDAIYFRTGHGNSLPTAMAIVAEGVKGIFINKKFLEAPAWFQDAILMHEEGHINLNVVYEFKETYTEDETNNVMSCEYQADLYSAGKGYRMKDALKYMMCFIGEELKPQLNLRIANLSNHGY